VQSEERQGDSFRIVADRPDPFRDRRYLVFVEASPPGDLVEQPVIIELNESVRSEGNAVGLLITPYAIDHEGLPALSGEVALIDGGELRRLVAERLPARLQQLDRYRGVGPAPVEERAAEPLRPQPIG
jgi:hypothetical protein